jgi:hypothetical protein
MSKHTRPFYTYNLAIGTTSVTGSRVVPPGVSEVRLVATSDCYVSIGVNPVAAAPTATGATYGSILIRAGLPPECFKVGVGEQIAVIQSSATGVLNVAEMTE